MTVFAPAPLPSWSAGWDDVRAPGRAVSRGPFFRRALGRFHAQSRCDTWIEVTRALGELADGTGLYYSADRLRMTLASAGTHPWRAGQDLPGRLIASWNAHVFHSIAAALVDTSVPSAVAASNQCQESEDYLRVLVDAAKPWAIRARATEAGPVPPLRLEAETLPPWPQPCQVCTEGALDALLAVAGKLNTDLQHALAAVVPLVNGQGTPGAGLETLADPGFAQIRALQQGLVDAVVLVDYAKYLRGRHSATGAGVPVAPPLAAAEALLAFVEEIIELQHRLGQWIACPSLLPSVGPAPSPW